MKAIRVRLAGLTALTAAASLLAASEPETRLPSWLERNRVQAHFENGIQDDLSGLYEDLHPAIRSMGSEVLTRLCRDASGELVLEISAETKVRRAFEAVSG